MNPGNDNKLYSPKHLQRSRTHAIKRQRYEHGLGVFGIPPVGTYSYTAARTKKSKTASTTTTGVTSDPDDTQFDEPISFEFRALDDNQQMQDAQSWDYPMTPSPKLGEDSEDETNIEKEADKKNGCESTVNSPGEYDNSTDFEDLADLDNTNLTLPLLTTGDSGVPELYPSSITEEAPLVISPLVAQVAALKTEENVPSNVIMKFFKILAKVGTGELQVIVADIPKTPKAFEQRIGVFRFKRTLFWKCSSNEACEIWSSIKITPQFQRRYCSQGHSWSRHHEVLMVVHLRDQLQHLLPIVHSSICYKNESAAAKRLKAKVGFSSDDILLVMNTDGFPLTTTSMASAWPVLAWIYGTSMRSKKALNLLLLALWKGESGASKPDFEQLLGPVLGEIKRTETQPIPWKDKGGNLRKTRVFVLAVLADSMARNPLMGVRGFRSKYGCPFCFHKQSGAYFDYTEEMAPLRTHSDYLEGFSYEISTCSKLKSLTVKEQPSVMLTLPYFDMISGFPVDPLHCIFEGVFKLLTNGFLNSSNHSYRFYISPKNQRVLDSLLISQLPPNRVRAPRSLTMRKHFRAHEWHVWSLYYSPILLQPFLPPDIYKHYMLLVEAVSDLMTPCSAEEIDRSEDSLREFCRQTPSLYPQEFGRFNVHLLLHLPFFVREHGTLSDFTMSPFESMNYKLKSYVTGSQFKVQQITSRYLQYLASLSVSTGPNKSKVKKKAFESPIDDFSNIPAEYKKIKGIQKYGKYVGGAGTPLCSHALNTTIRHNNCCYFISEKKVLELDFFVVVPPDNKIFVSARLYTLKWCKSYISHLFQVVSSKKVFMESPKCFETAMKITNDNVVHFARFLNDLELIAE